MCHRVPRLMLASASLALTVAVATACAPRVEPATIVLRMIGVLLFGPNAGNWFESGVSSSVVGELLPAISNTGMIAGTITGDNGKSEAYAWMPNHAGFHLGTLPADFASYAYATNHQGRFIVGQSIGERLGTIVSTAVVWTAKVNYAGGTPTLAW